MKKLLRVVLALTALGSLACAPERRPTDIQTAGGDDYPNAIEVLGKRSASAYNYHENWNSAFHEMPDSVPGAYDTVQVPESAQPQKSEPLPKFATLSQVDVLPILSLDSILQPDSLLDSVKTVVDSTDGKTTVVRTRDTDKIAIEDSVVSLPPKIAAPLPGDSVGISTPRIVEVAGSFTYKEDGRIERFRFSDGDGDGVLTAEPGSDNVAAIELSTAWPSGEKKVRLLRIAAGDDLDFNRQEGNLLLSSRFVKLQNLDTVEVWELLDAEGKGSILDYSLDSNIVDWVGRVTGAGVDTEILEIQTRIRWVVFPDAGRNYVVYFREENILRDGGRIALEIRGERSDSTFRPGERASITRLTEKPEGDTATTSIRWSVDVDANPASYANNRLVSFQVKQRYRRGDWESFEFFHIPDVPVPAGSSEVQGFTEATLVPPSQAAYSFSGLRSATGWKGTVAGPENRIWQVRYSPQGQVLSATRE